RRDLVRLPGRFRIGLRGRLGLALVRLAWTPGPHRIPRPRAAIELEIVGIGGRDHLENLAAEFVPGPVEPVLYTARCARDVLARLKDAAFRGPGFDELFQ